MRLLWLAVLMLVASCGFGVEYTMPVVSGAYGQKPEVRIPRGQPGPSPRVVVLHEGSGPRTRPGEVVLANVDIRLWKGNKPYLSTFDADQPTTVDFDGGHVSGAWKEALVGRSAGSRVLLVSPAAKGLDPRAAMGFGLLGAPAAVPPADSMVLVFDILGSYPADARLIGQALPTLPGDLRMAAPARILIDGSGPLVKPGGRVVVQYIGAQWPGREIFDSSAARGGPSAFTLKPGAVPPGWVAGLTGHRVGSRVVVTVPATATAGFIATTGGIAVPQGKAVVYVVDIIDAL